ncbi:hypothetical protein HYV64_02930 [Candidatus Shapirobacteria bacterium]|nr:hypothetical protein [Candidatus Shapirobacteria bacterium]
MFSLGFYYFFFNKRTSLISRGSTFRIVADATARFDYGLTYPLTYKFQIPLSSSGIQVWKKDSPGGSYIQLTEKTSPDIFNGIEAVRFDYTLGYAYVSILFPQTSDSFYVKFIRNNGDGLTGVTFLNFTQYYDNRVSAAVFTMDDCGVVQLSDFETASDTFASKGVWVTAGFFHMGDFTAETWENIQSKIDNGYIEPASHSMSHLPMSDDFNVGESRQTILDNLTMPPLNKKGSKEYLFAWITPLSKYSEVMQAKVGEYKYLTNVAGFGTYVYEGIFPVWDEISGLYEHWDRYAFAESVSLATMNAQFDSDHAAGKIYHLGLHPQNVSWRADGDFPLHLDYVKNRTDVWYVGMGHLMVYRYATEHIKIEIINTNFDEI